MDLVYQNEVGQESSRPIFLICVFRNEAILLPYFIQYYKRLGVTHFIMIDNASDDEGAAYLSGLNDINIKLFFEDSSYKDANFGMAWVNQCLQRYCINQYCLVVDADELFTLNEVHYKHINELIDEMELNDLNVAPATLLDMYPKELNDDYNAGDKFLDHCRYFDRWNERYYLNKKILYSKFYWRVGGLRARTLNTENIISKFPFFKFNFSPLVIRAGCHFFANETHLLFASKNIRLTSNPCVLMHFKFIRPDFSSYLDRMVLENQHWHESKEYKQYQIALNGREYVSFFDEKFSQEYREQSDLAEFWRSVV